MRMTRACLFLALVSLVVASSVDAQAAQRVDRTYVSASGEMALQIETIDSQRVRVGADGTGTWEADGFSVTMDQFGTRIRSTGEARGTSGGVAMTVDSVEFLSVNGRIYMFLRNVRWQVPQ